MDFNTGYQKGFLQGTSNHWLLRSNVRLYGSGRGAFIDIATHLARRGLRRLWLPAWQCCELIHSLNAIDGLELHFYEIDDVLKPETNVLERLDPNNDVLLLVDYFASLNWDESENIWNRFHGHILLDAVHSWLSQDLSKVLPSNVTIVSGFRKLFWKIGGALVTGGITSSLPWMPSVLPSAAPGFPRNLSLSPRYGIFTKLILARNNLNKFDEISMKWPSSIHRGPLDGLRSPVKLLLNSAPAQDKLWSWPDLYEQLSPKLKNHAEKLRYKYRVTSREETRASGNR